jgi:predicted ATPase with chaperone activity
MSLEDAGLSEELVGGLVLKVLHARGSALGIDLFDTLALPMSMLDEVLEPLQSRRLIEVHATKGPRRGEWIFRLTDAGRARAAEEMEVCRYIGPAPVPFDQYRRWTELQAVEKTRVSDQRLKEATEGIVVPDATLDLLGPAVNSGRSLFLFGGPGNGKTLLAERIARLFGEPYYVPTSVLLDDSVMLVHDPVHHHFGEHEHEPARTPPEGESPSRDGSEALREILRSLPDHDRRYVKAKRPVVVTGGELTLEQLDLQWDPSRRMYQAPPQVKAAGGVLLVDDLGRQKVPVADLLNRWVIPLEHGRDHLALASGRTLVVPFDCFVIFSTNLRPRELGDEAFLRRIRYKIELHNPDRAEYSDIFRSCCAESGIAFQQAAVDYVFDTYYEEQGIEPRRCHPRDVIDHVRDVADYRGEHPHLGAELLETACRSCFLPPD